MPSTVLLRQAVAARCGQPAGFGAAKPYVHLNFPREFSCTRSARRSRTLKRCRTARPVEDAAVPHGFGK